MDQESRRTPRQERAQATVEALLMATAQVLVEEGYARASTNRIARRAGVSVGSLYQYFSNKDALIHALLEQLVDQQFALLGRFLGDQALGDPEQTIRGVLRALIQTKQAQPELTRVLYEQIPRSGQFDQVERWQHRAQELIQAHLETRRAQIRPQNLELAAYMLVQTFHGVTTHAVLYHPELLRGDQLLEELIELVLRYLRPDPPPP